MAEYIMDIMDEANSKMAERLAELPKIKGEDVGLDNRSGRFWIDTEESLIITRVGSSIEYYGGFEYVDSEDKTIFGDYVVYHNGDRVEDAIAYYVEHG